MLAWSGMRGVVTLAAAQSLPTDLPYRPQLVLIAFTVALVTLVGQGGTLPLLIRKLQVTGSDEAKDRAELAELFEEISELGLAPLDNPDLRRDDGSSYDAEVIERVRVETRRKAALASERAAEDVAGPHVQHLSCAAGCCWPSGRPCSTRVPPARTRPASSPRHSNCSTRRRPGWDTRTGTSRT